MNGSNVKELREAYNSIYSQNDFEFWVDSLLDEGYDLSDYTWDEMYESYLTEAGVYNPAAYGTTTKGSVTMYGPNDPKRFTSATSSRFDRPRDAGTPEYAGGGGRSGTPVRYKRPPIASLPSDAKQVNQYPQGVSTGVGGRNAGSSIQPSTRRLAPTTQRPATPQRPSSSTTPTRPATPAPSAGQTGDKSKDMATWAKANPKLAAAAAERARTRGTSQSINPLMRDHYDLYDIILSHLLDEGYVETPEAAEVIMVNMSEDWRESILESFDQFMAEALPLAVMGQTSSYGPGLYGNKTASGQVLTPQTRGIAHRTLPLGSAVRLTVPGGKTVDTTVIDRGPYVGDRQADLTTQTTRDLGFPDYKKYGVRNIDVSPITKTKTNPQSKLTSKNINN